MLKVKITFNDNHQETYICSSLDIFSDGKRMELYGGDVGAIHVVHNYKELTISNFNDAGL